MAAACQPSQVLSLVEDIKLLASSPDASSAQSHFRLLGLVDQLKLAVETPTETALRLIYQVRCDVRHALLLFFADAVASQPPQNAALRTVIDLGLFQLLVKHPDGRSAKDLAVHSGAERALVGRIPDATTTSARGLTVIQCA